MGIVGNKKNLKSQFFSCFFSVGTVGTVGNRKTRQSQKYFRKFEVFSVWISVGTVGIVGDMEKWKSSDFKYLCSNFKIQCKWCWGDGDFHDLWATWVPWLTAFFITLPVFFNIYVVTSKYGAYGVEVQVIMGVLPDNYLGIHSEWYIPCSDKTCKNSGQVLRAPMMLNKAKVIFHRHKAPRISIRGLVDMYCWPPKISNM